MFPFRHLLTSAAVAALLPLAAQAEYYWELSEPLFGYCDRLAHTALPIVESADFLAQCEQTRAERERAESGAIAPKEYLASLRALDNAYNKSLWEVHLKLRGAVARDDVELFNAIAALEERAPFQMGGFLKQALEFMQRHKIEVPYYINPDAVDTGRLQYE